MIGPQPAHQHRRKPSVIAKRFHHFFKHCGGTFWNITLYSWKQIHCDHLQQYLLLYLKVISEWLLLCNYSVKRKSYEGKFKKKKKERPKACSHMPPESVSPLLWLPYDMHNMKNQIIADNLMSGNTWEPTACSLCRDHVWDNQANPLAGLSWHFQLHC